ncbi:hypothetical protein [Sphingomonas sp.]|jgi:hypothetical protein|uniref:putative quinol monooxygenase n=1 Tax=Sphingomonas sp. TaxID=28214 RepID=UPI0026262B08|nr:hypothetical protein [Sphingomonas sp.]MDF2495671.1 hypothetical protein [Sphingomonas sp.]
MTNATPPSTRPEDLASAPGPIPHPQLAASAPHRGVIVTGENGGEGHKAFYIHIEAKPGKEDEVVRMLNDIYGCVLDEPATGPWFAVRYSPTTFGIFEAFPSIAGRDAHVAGGGGDIFRDKARMNEILSAPAHVFRLDILLNKAGVGI